MTSREFASTVRKKLLDFYGFPKWRNPLPPLDELVSTILSQNTNDVNRDRAFETLKAKYPDWIAVRDADEGELINTIRTAGLANRKGPRIQKLLKQISEQRGDLDLDFLADLSSDEAREWLLQFEGVGPKTASIVLQFSLNKPAFPVDTHIYRVTGRLGLRPQRMNADKAHQYLEELFERDAYYEVHLNIIRLGREICNARNPKCEVCPLGDICEYYSRLKIEDHELFDAPPPEN